MKRSSNNRKMKAKVNKEDFTPDELEVSESFLLLGTPFIMEETPKLEITLGGKSIHETTDNNDVDLMPPQINIPNDVTNNKYNPPDIPTIPGVPHNNIVGCCKPFEKKLYCSDLDKNLNRLMMNTRHVIEYFLPLLKEGEKVEDGIKVVVYDMQGKTLDMTFKYWKSGRYYILNGGWTTFFQTHNLKDDQLHYATVWMFRHSETDQLCFALSVRTEQTKKEGVIRGKKKGKSYNVGKLGANHMKRTRSLNLRVADGEGTSRPAELTPEMHELIHEMGQDETLMQHVLPRQQTLDDKLEHEPTMDPKIDAPYEVFGKEKEGKEKDENFDYE